MLKIFLPAATQILKKKNCKDWYHQRVRCISKQMYSLVRKVWFDTSPCFFSAKPGNTYTEKIFVILSWFATIDFWLEAQWSDQLQIEVGSYHLKDSPFSNPIYFFSLYNILWQCISQCHCESWGKHLIFMFDFV